jgi:hypothetical protein
MVMQHQWSNYGDPLSSGELDQSVVVAGRLLVTPRLTPTA